MLILTTQMFPLVVLIIPLFVIMRNADLIGTYQGLILAYLTFTVPLAIWTRFCLRPSLSLGLGLGRPAVVLFAANDAQFVSNGDCTDGTSGACYVFDRASTRGIQPVEPSGFPRSKP